MANSQTDVLDLKRRKHMQTIDEAREHCRFVGKGIETMVADGDGTPSLPGSATAS